MRTRSVLLLFLCLACLAGCGDEGGPKAPAETTPSDATPAETAPQDDASVVVAGPLPGRDGEGVLELLPGDARDVLEGAERMELIALHPYVGEGKDQAKGEPFHEYTVLGRADVPKADQRALLEALYAGLNANNDMAASCFNPRHGLRVTQGERTVDLVLCFECLQIEAHGADPAKETSGLTTETPEPAFDALLKKLGLPKHRDE